MSKVCLCFLAHPDDAEILCAGTLIRLVDSGWEVHIATATAGDCGTADRNSWDIVSIRTQEAAAACRLIGATYHCLGEKDGLIVYDKPTITKTFDLFRKIAPSLVFTHAPKDYMIDHEQVSLLARGASFLYAAPNAGTTPVRWAAAVPHLYYCDPIEGVDPMGREVTPTTFINVSAVHERKLAMLACHASQRDWLRSHHGMDEYLDAVKRHDAQRAKTIGTAYAEGFIQHLGHAYPHNDLLVELFPSKEK